MDTTHDTQQTLDTLNSLLRGELSAVETYDQALEKIRDEPIADLRENRNSHGERVSLLRSHINQIGGVPDTSSGAWGSFANLVEGGAKLFGRDAAIAALEEGEDRGLADYRDSLGKVDQTTREFIERRLLPVQERTHRRMSDLKKLGSSRGTVPGRTNYTIALLAALGLPLMSLGGCGNDRHVAINEVPEPARSAIVRQANDGRITEIEEERDNGQACYDVTVQKGDKSYNYTIDHAGNVRK